MQSEDFQSTKLHMRQIYLMVVSIEFVEQTEVLQLLKVSACDVMALDLDDSAIPFSLQHSRGKNIEKGLLVNMT